jgi:hypothetical protein
MKNSRIFPLLTFILFICGSYLLQAQTGYEDVVYLKNGSIIHGIIIEQIPNISIQIKTADDNLFIYKMAEIEKITKEPVINKGKPSVTGNNEPIRKEGNSFYRGSNKLSKEAVSQILLQSNIDNAHEYWESGQDKMRAGRTIFWVGFPLTLIGAGAGIGYAIDGATPPFIIMCVATPIGVGLMAGGVIVIAAGNKSITRAIDTYNSSLRTSSIRSKVTVSFGLSNTFPGVGMLIRF